MGDLINRNLAIDIVNACGSWANAAEELAKLPAAQCGDVQEVKLLKNELARTQASYNELMAKLKTDQCYHDGMVNGLKCALRVCLEGRDETG